MNDDESLQNVALGDIEAFSSSSADLSIPFNANVRHVTVPDLAVRSLLPEFDFATMTRMSKLVVVTLDHESLISDPTRAVNDPNGHHGNSYAERCDGKQEPWQSSPAVEVPCRAVTASDLEPSCQVRVRVAVVLVVVQTG